MKAIGAITLGHLNRLITLDVSNNLIKRIHPGAFGHSNDIETLHLHGNRLEEVEKGTFYTATHLKSVNLSNNSISDPGKLDLEGLIGLTNLDVSYNYLKSIKSSVFKSMANNMLRTVQVTYTN